MIVTQSLLFIKAAFTCIRSLWNRKPLKVYGGRMAESMLAILCHILRGEPVIQERLSKETVRPEEEAAAAAAVAPSTVSLAPSGGAPGASTTAGEAPAVAATVPAVPAGGSADDSTNSTPRRDPQVNQAQLTQVCGKVR